MSKNASTMRTRTSPIPRAAYAQKDVTQQYTKAEPAAAPIPAPEVVSEITASLDYLRNSLHELGGVALLFVDHLAPILAPNNPPAEDSTADVIIESSLAHQLNEMRSHVIGITNMLRTTLERSRL